MLKAMLKRKKKKKKVTDNESVGSSLHVPHTQLRNVLIHTQHHVTVFLQ